MIYPQDPTVSYHNRIATVSLYSYAREREDDQRIIEAYKPIPEKDFSNQE